MWLCLAPAWEVKLDKLEREPGWQLETPRPRARSRITRPKASACSSASELGTAGSPPEAPGEPDLASPRAGKVLPVAWQCLLGHVCLPSVIGSRRAPAAPAVCDRHRCAATQRGGELGTEPTPAPGLVQRCVPAQVGTSVCTALCPLLAPVNVACFDPYMRL